MLGIGLGGTESAAIVPASYNPPMALPLMFVSAAPASSAGPWPCCWRATGCASAWCATAAPAGGAASDVRAYALNAASRDLLEMLRAWPDAQHATPVLAHAGAWRRGRRRCSFDAQAQGVPALAWIVDVQALQERLADALRYQPLVEWLDAPQPAALTVVCEGRASITRAEFGVQFEVTPYPQRAIAARLHCEKPHGQLARQWFADGEILAFLPLGGSEPARSGNSVAVVWSVQEQRAPELLALDDAAFEAQLEAASHHGAGQADPGQRAGGLAAAAGAGRPLVRTGLGAGGRCGAHGASAGGPGPEPGAGRRQGAGAGAARARILAQRGRL